MFKNYKYKILRATVLLICFCSFSQLVKAQAEREADLKAVFIYNFTKYVEWDSSMVENDFVITVIGASPVAASLNEVAKTNAVKNRRIVIRRINRPEEIGKCQILFIPQKTPFPLEAILSRTGKGVLTVSEEPGFASLGTAFNFVIKSDKLKFEANLAAIVSAGLRVSSQLLKLATIVDGSN